MEFQKIVEDVLSEDVIAGGTGSVFGSNVGATSTHFSGDNYAPGDARTPKSLYGKVMTRKGVVKSNKKTKAKKKSK